MGFLACFQALNLLFVTSNLLQLTRRVILKRKLEQFRTLHGKSMIYGFCCYDDRLRTSIYRKKREFLAHKRILQKWLQRRFLRCSLLFSFILCESIANVNFDRMKNFWVISIFYIHTSVRVYEAILWTASINHDNLSVTNIIQYKFHFSIN